MTDLSKMKIHHIGYLVKNIDRAKELFLSMGYQTIQETVFDEFRGTDICFMEKEGYCIELVSPKGEDSVVKQLSKKIGNAPYHICYETDDLEKAVKNLRKQRFVIWQEPHEANALQNRKAAFLIHSQAGMIELVEQFSVDGL